MSSYCGETELEAVKARLRPYADDEQWPLLVEVLEHCRACGHNRSGYADDLESRRAARRSAWELYDSVRPAIQWIVERQLGHPYGSGLNDPAKEVEVAGRVSEARLLSARVFPDDGWPDPQEWRLSHV